MVHPATVPESVIAAEPTVPKRMFPLATVPGTRE